MSAKHQVRYRETKGGAVAQVVFEHGKGNILTTALIAEIQGVILQCLRNTHLKLITLEGAGSHFSYGASIEEHAAEAIAAGMRALRELVLTIAGSPVPVAALVRGYCLGGGFELAMACHFIFAAPETQFGLPEIKLGVYPPVACAMLPRLVGQALADRMVITGENMDGETLCRHGLVHSVASSGDLHAAIEAWFDSTLAGFSASSLRHATRASRAEFLRGLGGAIAARERDYVEKLLSTFDAGEGVRAFLEKRPPQWRNE